MSIALAMQPEWTNASFDVAGDHSKNPSRAEILNRAAEKDQSNLRFLNGALKELIATLEILKKQPGSYVGYHLTPIVERHAYLSNAGGLVADAITTGYELALYDLRFSYIKEKVKFMRGADGKLQFTNLGSQCLEYRPNADTPFSTPEFSHAIKRWARWNGALPKAGESVPSQARHRINRAAAWVLGML